MTAAEAAAALAQEVHEGRPRYSRDEAVPFGQTEGEEDAPCASDDDCTISRVAPHACCPMLCEPRAVTKKAAQVIEAHTKSCSMFKCPEPACRPPRQSTAPACVQNRCVMKPVGAAGPN